MTPPRPPTDSAAGPVRRPGGRSAEVRRRVLDAVRAHLVEYGYDALGIDAVAERSGVHRTTVYRRWRDVGGLLADVLAEATGDDWRAPDTGSLEGDLCAVNAEVYAALTAEPPLTMALIAASFRSAPAADALRSFWADRYDRCAVIVHRAVRRGEVPAGCNPRRLLVAATAPLYHELVLLRTTPDPEIAVWAARNAVAAACAGTFSVAAARAGTFSAGDHTERHVVDARCHLTDASVSATRPPAGAR